MLDAAARRLIDPPLTKAGAVLARVGISATVWTLIGFAVGIGCFVAIVQGDIMLALGLLLLNRLIDGLDGAVARATTPSDFGGYLDIVADFLVWALLPVGFALNDSDKALMSALLLASFIGTGTTFLAHAILAERLGLTSDERGKKSFFHLGGLIEGTETTLFFFLLILLPGSFYTLSALFVLVCILTTLGRILDARRAFAPNR